MTQPLVSIIIPVYNAEKWLSDCLESSLRQSEKNIEIIAVDDASTDGSWEILQAFAERDLRIKIMRNAQNQGQATTRNTAIERSTGKWLAFLDNDDEYAPDFCKILLAEAERSRADIIKGRARIIEPNGFVHETPLEMHRKIMQKSPLCFNESWWTAIYLADKIRGKISLNENASLCEDLIFIVEAVTLPATVSCVDDIVYIHKRRLNSGAERTRRSLKKIEACIDGGISILNTLNERKIFESDPYGYMLWVREALSWLGGFSRAQNDEYAQALKICLTKSPQVVSLIQCNYSGIKKYFMTAIFKFLGDDQLKGLRKLLFQGYGYAKRLNSLRKN